MRFALFYHSLLSDWNHGNAHFLRGVAAELLARGHEVRVFEPAGAWSLRNLFREHGAAPLRAFRAAYPALRSHRYGRHLDLDRALDGVDVVVVHEWNDPGLVARIGAYRARARGLLALFHDTHHRAVTAPEQMRDYDLRDYDGALAFGRTIRDLYLERGWIGRAFTWHEAADVRVFGPVSRPVARRRDLVWIGNWGDDERSAELAEFLIAPVAALGLSAQVHGVRYPRSARRILARAGIDYRGWLPNHAVPGVFARHRVTVHVPRRPYIEALPGIPTIRPFEALACGIPLVSSPWHDSEGLFAAGRDYLVARDGAQMRRHLRAVLADPGLAGELAAHGRRTILARHTCGHRVDELLAICRALGAPVSSGAATPASLYTAGRGTARRATPSAPATAGAAGRATSSTTGRAPTRSTTTRPQRGERKEPS